MSDKEPRESMKRKRSEMETGATKSASPMDRKKSFNLKFWRRGDPGKKASSRKIGETKKKEMTPEEEAKKS